MGFECSRVWVGWGLGVRVWGLGFGVRAAVLENCLTKFFPNTFYSGCMKECCKASLWSYKLTV